MTPETLSAFLLFAALMVGTPGPASMIALSAGARFGVRACIGLIGGMIAGKFLLIAALGAGLFGVLQGAPILFEAMRWASFAYMVWLSWRIAGMSMTAREAQRPLGFADGVIVHPLNPKAWAMITTALTQFTDLQAAWWPQVVAIMLGFAAMQSVFHTLWCAAGERIAALVAGTKVERGLMIALGLATLATLIWAMFWV